MIRRAWCWFFGHLWLTYDVVDVSGDTERYVSQDSHCLRCRHHVSIPA